MSYAYSRIPKEVAPSKTYGFEKVPLNKLPRIIARLQRTTHGSSCYEPRNLNLCDRARGNMPPSAPKRLMSDRDINRVVRRLKTPTISKLSATGLLDPEYEARLRCDTPLRLGTEEHRPKTGPEFRKFLKRITRGTCSSRGKGYDQQEPTSDIAHYFDLDFSAPPRSKDAANEIFDRVKTPTMASQRQHPDCHRRPNTTKCLSQEERRNLPLVSGLPRSRGVSQIVDRLYHSAKEPRTQTVL